MAKWAMSLGAEAGARYLHGILDYSVGNEERPIPPWDAVCGGEDVKYRNI